MSRKTSTTPKYVPPTPRERLQQMMDDAILGVPGMLIPENAIEAFSKALAAEDDFALAWELCANTRKGEMIRLFGERRAKLSKHLVRSVDEGRHEHETQKRTVPRAADKPIAVGGSHRSCETHNVSATINGNHKRATSIPMKPTGGLSPVTATPSPVYSQAGVAAVLSSHQKAWLDIIPVNGRAIGDCTADELVRSASTDEHHARFKRLLAEIAERSQWRGKIRDVVSDSEASHLWDLAREASNAG